MARSPRASTFRSFVTALRIATRPGGPSIGARLASLPRLVRAVARGDYRSLTPGRLLLFGAALAYLVSPLDLVPEALLGPLGLGDDAMVLAWLATELVTESEAFLTWEKGREPVSSSTPAGGQTVPGSVLR